MTDQEEVVSFASDEQDPAVTLPEWLAEEEKLEEDASAVLAGSDEENCTYLRGYVPRQALYACKTCRGSDGEPFGVCLACSYACHEKHELYELYTKRAFRCDCGNSKVPKNKCNLFPDKSATNPYNKYNHNFSGLYCTCERPYPDPENTADTCMYQCIACEDWFHDYHLNSEIPEDKGFAEMICGQCMGKLDFLWYYHTDSKIDESESTGKELQSSTSGDDVKTENEQGASQVDLPKDDPSVNDDKMSDPVSSTTSSQCKLDELKNQFSVRVRKGATFWRDGWRSSLCKCSPCRQNYIALDCAFICEEEDTVQFYEKQGEEKNTQTNHYEKALNEINRMDRVKSLEVMHGYNFMAGELKKFLEGFAVNKKVVRQEDIQEFYEDLKSRKRPRYQLFNC
ncbi:putative E3 ubiquitin-protein ligase UBR7 [Brevipalpus obovatus]|uniref:putative E3 ubiquitin-protein ligase UBR7 n=1 Tax=Brevipalpus obovatus TaxID=246614 RepID=UPI003D9DF69B